MTPVPYWDRWAKCRGIDTEVFYPEKTDGGNTDPAKRICATCPVRPRCLEYAVVNGEPHGVWGGLSEAERRKLKRDGWKPGDPTPEIRFASATGANDITCDWAEETFTHARQYGTRQTSQTYRVSPGFLTRAWDRYELGRPCRRGGSTGHPQNTPVKRSRAWAQATFQEAMATSTEQVARQRHVSHHTLLDVWAQYGLGRPTTRRRTA